jgi:hypothetical protein
VSQETTNRSFDELARSLAEGSISRRRALKLFAGTAIAAMIPSTRAMAAITCPPGTVKICHVPRRADGTCRRGEAETRCVTPEAAKHASHPCDCCGGCGGTDNCREPRPRTCFSTTPMCIPDGEACSADSDCCSSICFGGSCIPATAIAICCRCQGGCIPTTCIEHDCSDATALNQLCTEICGGCGGFVMGSYTCTPNTCLCGSLP